MGILGGLGLEHCKFSSVVNAAVEDNFSVAGENFFPLKPKDRRRSLKVKRRSQSF